MTCIAAYHRGVAMHQRAADDRHVDAGNAQSYLGAARRQAILAGDQRSRPRGDVVKPRSFHQTIDLPPMQVTSPNQDAARPSCDAVGLDENRISEELRERRTAVRRDASKHDGVAS